MEKSIGTIYHDVRFLKNYNLLEVYFTGLKDFVVSPVGSMVSFINHEELYIIRADENFMRMCLSNIDQNKCITFSYTKTAEKVRYANNYVVYKLEYKCKYIDYIIDQFIDSNFCKIADGDLDDFFLIKLSNALYQTNYSETYKFRSTEVSNYLTNLTVEERKLLLEEIQTVFNYKYL